MKVFIRIFSEQETTLKNVDLCLYSIANKCVFKIEHLRRIKIH